MENLPKANTRKAGNRVFKLITGEIIFGDVTVIEEDNGIQFLVEKPFEAKDGAIMPYLIKEFGNGPGAVQFHIMNVIWSLPLDEFEQANKGYAKATSEIVQPEKPSIIMP